MKTEKEFLEGIYQKASFVEEESSRSRLHPYRKYSIVIAAAMLAFLILPVGISKWGSLYKSEKPAEPMVEPNSISYRSMKKSTNVFDGTIMGIDKEETHYILRVKIEDTYIGKSIDESTILVSDVAFTAITTLNEGDKALFYVVEQEGEFYLNEEEYGVCRYLKSEGTQKVFETQYGDKIYSNDIK